MVAIFVISLLIILIIPKIREIESGTVKTVLYIFMGLVMFTLVGFAFNLWENQPTGDLIIAADIVAPYTQFYPALILAMALAATVLITYMEKDNYASFFAGAGFAVLLPDMYLYVFKNQHFDLALLGCVLWAMIPMIWAFLWKDSASTDTTYVKKVVLALKSTVLTYSVYLLTAIISVFCERGGAIDIGVLTGIANSVQLIIMFILGTMWFFFLFNIIVVLLMFVVHDLALRLFNYKRVVGTRSVTYEKIKPVSAKAEAPRPKVNHYAGLIEEMQVFSKYIGEVDRIRAASTIGRFKNEYQTLAVKYNEDSKSDAEKMIKKIELEFMQKY
jgi:hypothetical protein